MEEGFRLLWQVLTPACLIWYSTVTIFVAVKGGNDIRNMIARLRQRNQAPPDE